MGDMRISDVVARAPIGAGFLYRFEVVQLLHGQPKLIPSQRPPVILFVLGRSSQR